jgi:transposase-like protein
MKGTRKRHNAEFKTKVVLEALKEQQSISEIAQKHGVHPNQIQTWKKQFLSNASAAFGIKSKADHEEDQSSKLYEQIGKLQMENDWLKKKLS